MKKNKRNKTLYLALLLGTTKVERLTAKGGLILALILSLIAIIDIWQR